MARRRKRKTKKAQTDAAATAGWYSRLSEPARQRLRRWLGRAAVAAVLIAAAAMGGTALERYVHALPEMRPELSVALEDLPEWVVRNSIDRQVLREVRLEPGTELLDPSLARHVGEQLAASAWVRQVRRVLKHPDGRVTARCEFRRPMVLVQSGAMFYAVDRDGVRLPGSYSSSPGWLLIQGIEAAAPAPGEVWPGADLAKAVEMADLVDSAPTVRRRIAGIRMHNYAGRRDPAESHVVLVVAGGANGGGQVLFGAAPGEEIPPELDAEQKVRRLADPAVDLAQPVIDIRLPGRISYRRAAFVADDGH